MSALEHVHRVKCMATPAHHICFSLMADGNEKSGSDLYFALFNYKKAA